MLSQMITREQHNVMFHSDKAEKSSFTKMKMADLTIFILMITFLFSFGTAQDYTISCQESDAKVILVLRKSAFGSPTPCRTPPTSVTFLYATGDNQTTIKTLCKVNYRLKCPVAGEEEQQHCKGCRCNCVSDEGPNRTYHLDFNSAAIENGGSFFSKVTCLQVAPLPSEVSENCEHFGVAEPSGSAETEEEGVPVGIIVGCAVVMALTVMVVMGALAYQRRKKRGSSENLDASPPAEQEAAGPEVMSQSADFVSVETATTTEEESSPSSSVSGASSLPPSNPLQSLTYQMN